ncbi:unnamed protein product, partial [Ectocarpus sp. 12 AP-2014]
PVSAVDANNKNTPSGIDPRFCARVFRTLRPSGKRAKVALPPAPNCVRTSHPLRPLGYTSRNCTQQQLRHRSRAANVISFYTPPIHTNSRDSATCSYARPRDALRPLPLPTFRNNPCFCGVLDTPALCERLRIQRCPFYQNTAWLPYTTICSFVIVLLSPVPSWLLSGGVIASRVSSKQTKHPRVHLDVGNMSLVPCQAHQQSPERSEHLSHSTGPSKHNKQVGERKGCGGGRWRGERATGRDRCC